MYKLGILRCCGFFGAPAIALAGLTPAAAAELAGYLSVTTDYVWRGVTQSDGDPSAQLGLDINLDGGFYAGVWGSTVDISNGPARQRDTQVNYYAGYNASIADQWTLGGHVVAYNYPGADSDVDYDYIEYSIGASFDDMVWIEFSISDDLYDSGATTRNLEIYFEQTIATDWTIGGGAGYYDVSDFVTSGYGHWQLGVSRPIGIFDVDLRYHDANRWVPVVSSPDRAEPRVALSVRWSF